MAIEALAAPRAPDLAALFAARGWLSAHPASFGAQVIANCVVISADPGSTVFREGDPSRGLYGIIAGTIGVEGGHPRQTPLLGHVMHIGDWFGIKAPLHGGPRELTYRVLEPCRLAFIANTRLVPLMRADPDAAIRIGQLAELGNRLGAWIARDLLTPDAGQRLASVLLRVLALGEVAPSDANGFWLTHRQLGEMANLSRHHVGRKLADFAAAGWIACGYNRIRLRDAEGLAAFAYGDAAG